MRPCYLDYITLRSEGTSKSGLYVEDLPGFPIDSVNILRTDDVSSLSEFWTRFYARCVQNFSTYIGGKVGKRFYNGEVTESYETGRFREESNATSEQYAGVRFDFPNHRYRETHLLRIRVNVESVGSPLPSFIVFDKVGGSVLDTITVTSLSVGENEIQVYKVYDSDELYIAYDTSQVTLKQTAYPYRHYDRQDNLTFIGQVNGGGIIAEINNFCSMEKFVCTRLHALKNVFWHFIGRELMLERVLTNNINRYTTLTKEKADELLGYYNQQLEEVTKSALKHVRINDDKICMECRGTVAQKKALP